MGLLLIGLLLSRGAAGGETATPPLPPLPEGTGLERLPVPGFLPSVVAWPQATPSRPLPIVVAAHGSYDQPEWNCQTYQRVVAGRAVIVCPRGRLRWDTPQEPSLLRFFFPSGHGNGAWLGREVDAAVGALRTSASQRVDAGPVLYAGFSQGAILGAPLIISQPARFPRALLVEGGHGAWDPSSARAYARGGGQRVLFACGRASCTQSARAAAAHLARAGVQVKVVAAEGEGHTYDGRVAAEIASALPWLLEGDPRFAAPEPQNR